MLIKQKNEAFKTVEIPSPSYYKMNGFDRCAVIYEVDGTPRKDEMMIIDGQPTIHINYPVGDTFFETATECSQADFLTAWIKALDLLAKRTEEITARKGGDE